MPKAHPWSSERGRLTLLSRRARANTRRSLRRPQLHQGGLSRAYLTPVALLVLLASSATAIVVATGASQLERGPAARTTPFVAGPTGGPVLILPDQQPSEHPSPAAPSTPPALDPPSFVDAVDDDDNVVIVSPADPPVSDISGPVVSPPHPPSSSPAPATPPSTTPPTEEPIPGYPDPPLPAPPPPPGLYPPPLEELPVWSALLEGTIGVFTLLQCVVSLPDCPSLSEPEPPPPHPCRNGRLSSPRMSSVDTGPVVRENADVSPTAPVPPARRSVLEATEAPTAVPTPEPRADQWMRAPRDNTARPRPHAPVPAPDFWQEAVVSPAFAEERPEEPVPHQWVPDVTGWPAAPDVMWPDPRVASG